MRIRKGDTVIVISGKDRGQTGRVLRVITETERAIVEGVNIIKKHARPNPGKGIKGGIVQREAPVHLARLMPVDPQTKEATRVRHKFIQAQDGRRVKVRVAAASGIELDR